MVNIFQLEKKRGSKEKKKEIQGYYWNYLVNIFQLEKKEEDQKLKKKGNWPFATQNLSQYILFLEKKKKKKEREKNSCQIFPSRTKLPCHELLFLFLFPQINKKEKEQRKGYSLSFCFQKLSRKEYHLSL